MWVFELRCVARQNIVKFIISHKIVKSNRAVIDSCNDISCSIAVVSDLQINQKFLVDIMTNTLEECIQEVRLTDKYKIVCLQHFN